MEKQKLKKGEREKTKGGGRAGALIFHLRATSSQFTYAVAMGNVIIDASFEAVKRIN